MKRLSVVLLALLPAAAQPDYRLRFEVNLVQVDAIVTDKAGRHVPDLLRDDFTVYQDGRERPITHFVFVPEPPVAAPSPAASPHSLRKEDVRRAFAIVFDDVRMTFGEFSIMRLALLKYIDAGVQPGDLWALFRTSGGPGASRIFSSDPHQIRAGVRRMCWQHPPPALARPGRLLSEIFTAMGALSALPGRKVLILANSGLEPPNASRLRFAQGLFSPAFTLQIADRANRGSIVIYAIDSRGLVVTAAMPDNWQEASEPSKSYYRLTNPGNAAPRPLRYFESQSMPRDLAMMTGGLFFSNQNDLDRPLQEIHRDNAGYYLLGWNPGDSAFNRREIYHRIRIKVRRPGMKVRTRAGFFGMRGDAAPLPPLSPRQAIRDALAAPFRAGDINVQLRASFQRDSRLGPVIESLIHIAPERLTLQASGTDCRIASLEVLSTALPLDSTSGPPPKVESQTGSFEICGQTLARAMREGLVYILRDPVTRPGAYEMHVAVRNAKPGEPPSVGERTLIPRPTGSLDTGPIGAASEFVEVPDLRDDLALSGIRIQDAGPDDDAPRLTRPPIDRDPVIRTFHRGEGVPFRAELLGRFVSAPSVDWSRLSCRLTVLHEGTPVEDQVFRLKSPRIAGGYRTGAATPAGQYVLQLAVTLGAGKGKTVSQWTTFSVEP